MELEGIRIYHDGEFVKYGDAKVGLLTHGLNYGTGCFEGIRGYWNADMRSSISSGSPSTSIGCVASANLLLMDLQARRRAMCEHTIEARPAQRIPPRRLRAADRVQGGRRDRRAPAQRQR